MTQLQIEVQAQKYRSLVSRFTGLTFSWAMAQRLVGGEKRLKRLMAENKVRYDKPFGAANTRWMFNAEDIVCNVKPQLRAVNDC